MSGKKIIDGLKDAVRHAKGEDVGARVYEVRVQGFRLGSFATGDYLCRCNLCGAQFDGDKRSLNCLPCEISRLQQSLLAAERERDRLRGALARIIEVWSAPKPDPELPDRMAGIARSALNTDGGTGS